MYDFENLVKHLRRRLEQSMGTPEETERLAEPVLPILDAGDAYCGNCFCKKSFYTRLKPNYKYCPECGCMIDLDEEPIDLDKIEGTETIASARNAYAAEVKKRREGG